MSNLYSKKFSLTDIFNNKKLKNKIPLVNYKEKDLGDGKISYRTNTKTINRQVFDISTSAARPFYKPIKTTRSGDIMFIGGNLIGEQEDVVESVFSALNANKHLLLWTVNNMEMVRSALKEAQKNKRRNGIDSRLFLRAQSMMKIENMTKREMEAFLGNVMENIIFGDDFPETQKKFNVKDWNFGNGLNYEQKKLRWKHRVGDM